MRPIRDLDRRLRPVHKVVLALVVLVGLGTLLLLLPWSSPQGLTPGEALFTSISALTVTGLSVIVPCQDLTPIGQVILLALIQVGGVGYMVLAVTALRLIGRRVSLADRLALRDSLGLLNTGGVVELAGYIFRVVLVVETVGALLLFLHWRTWMPDGSAAFHAVFHTISSFCNAGFDLFSGDPQFPEGIPRDNYSLIIMGSLIFLGGIGIPVMFDFAVWPRKRQLTLHTKITVPLVLTLVVLGAMALFLSEYVRGGVLREMPLDRAIVMSFFQSVSARTAGFVGMPGLEELGAAGMVAITCLMFIGCAPASMGGGITTGTLATLVLALWAYARGDDTPLIKGRAIPGEMVRKAAAVLTVSILAVLGCTWTLALTHNAPLREIGFEVVSAFATCGLSLGLTDDLNAFGRIAIMLMMLWGRLGALTLVVALASSRSRRPVRYPEEKILIG